MPLSGQRGKGDSEVERRMRHLTTLRTSWKIVASDQIETIGGSNLAVRHMPIIAISCGAETPPRAAGSAALNRCRPGNGAEPLLLFGMGQNSAPPVVARVAASIDEIIGQERP